MIFYLHSSALAKLFITEPGSDQVAAAVNSSLAEDRHGEADATGLFGRFGERSGTGMLDNLFEDVTDADHARLASALKESGVVPSDAVPAGPVPHPPRRAVCRPRCRLVRRPGPRCRPVPATGQWPRFCPTPTRPAPPCRCMWAGVV